MKRTRLVPIRFTQEEYERIYYMAYDMNLDFSKYVRKLALGQQVRPPLPNISIETYVELGRIGNNLNQLTRAINQEVKLGHSPQLDPVPLVELLTLLQKVRLEIAGVKDESEL